MAAALQNLLDILGNLRRELYRCACCRELNRCLSARLLLCAFSCCLSARLLLCAFSCSLIAPLLLSAFSRGPHARLLLGAFSRACGFRQRGKPLPRLRL